jgi:hypothetical protein
MAFETVTPESALKMHEFIVKLHENKAHVKSVKVDTAAKMLRVDLDWAANFGGYSDVQIALLGSRIPDAKEIVAKILAESDQGIEPSAALSTRLFDCTVPNKR